MSLFLLVAGKSVDGRLPISLECCDGSSSRSFFYRHKFTVDKVNLFGIRQGVARGKEVGREGVAGELLLTSY